MHTSKKKILAIILSLFVLLLAAAYLCSTSFQGGVPVLNYHQINDRDHNALTLSTPEFEAQMQYLAENGYHPITPNELADHLENGAPLPEKPILLTFDDGYIDNYKNAYPILQKYGLKGSIFIITDYLNVYPNYLTWEICQEMQDSGIIDIECHTMTHVALSELSSAEELQHEAVDSKKAIESHLNKKVTSIAYPCGAYNDEPATARRSPSTTDSTIPATTNMRSTAYQSLAPTPTPSCASSCASSSLPSSPACKTCARNF